MLINLSARAAKTVIKLKMRQVVKYLRLLKSAAIVAYTTKMNLSSGEKRAVESIAPILLEFKNKYGERPLSLKIFQNNNESRIRFSPAYIGEPEKRTEEWSLARHMDRISATPKLGSLLLALVHRLRPEKILEVGSAFGVSTAYLLAGCAMNGAGHVYVIEKSDFFLSYAPKIWGCFAKYPVTLFRGDALEIASSDLLKNQHYDLVFLDASHNKDDTVRLFNAILPRVTFSGVVVIDDIYWTSQMNEAWQEVKKHPRSFFVCEFAGRYGIVVVS